MPHPCIPAGRCIPQRLHRSRGGGAGADGSTGTHQGPGIQPSRGACDGEAGGCAAKTGLGCQAVCPLAFLCCTRDQGHFTASGSVCELKSAACLCVHLACRSCRSLRPYPTRAGSWTQPAWPQGRRCLPVRLACVPCSKVRAAAASSSHHPSPSRACLTLLCVAVACRVHCELHVTVALLHLQSLPAAKCSRISCSAR